MIFSALETSDRKSLLRNTPFQGLNRIWASSLHDMTLALSSLADLAVLL